MASDVVMPICVVNEVWEWAWWRHVRNRVSMEGAEKSRTTRCTGDRKSAGRARVSIREPCGSSSPGKKGSSSSAGGLLGRGAEEVRSGLPLFSVGVGRDVADRLMRDRRKEEEEEDLSDGFSVGEVKEV